MDVDKIFEVTGEFGPYQIRQYLLLSFPILFSSYQTVAYIFTTGNPIYRCRVPECEGVKQDAKFDDTWVSEAIPFNDNGFPEQCIRYEPIIQHKPNKSQDFCYPYSFNKDNTISCDSWVYKDKEKTIVSEFQIMCPNNAWKIALVGTMNYLGFFIGMPVSGVFADRYGRRKVLAISCFVQSLIGIARSFSPNYEIFLSLQFMGAFMSGAYNAGFVLGLEIVGPRKRVLGNAIICCFHSIGEAIVGLLMWTLKDWRLFARYLFGPGLLSIIYLWIIPESIRWLITRGRTEETVEIFRKMAKVNNKKLPENINNNSLQLFNKDIQNGSKISTISKDEVPQVSDVKSKSSSFMAILRSSRLMLRLGINTYCWMVITMVFFGLSLVSTSVAGNKYLNFILTVLVELPGYMATWLLMDIVKVGRRLSLALSFFLTGLTCIAFNFIRGFEFERLLLFLLGKFAITFAYAVIYIFTAEMFPTEVRNTLLGICSMAGHIGSMLAPQTVLLTTYIEPMFLWGILSVIAAALSFLFPETLNTRLPDTVAEAERIGY